METGNYSVLNSFKIFPSFVVVIFSVVSVIAVLSTLSLYWLIPAINFPIAVATYKFRFQESILGGLASTTLLGGVYGILACVFAYVI